MLLDAESLQKSAEMDPAVIEFLKSNPAPKLDWADAASTYNSLEYVSTMMADQIGVAESAIIEEYRDVPMRDGFNSSIKIHRPASPPSAGSPLIVFFFGGGWIGGNCEVGTLTARAYVRLFGATVVNASYRLAPQHKFPTSQYDCWDTVKWLDAYAESRLGVNLSQGFLLSGISAGASNAACVTAHALEGAEPLTHPITGQHLSVPSIMDKDSVPAKYRAHFLSLEQNKDAPILSTSDLDVLADHTGWDAQSPWRFAVRSTAALSDFPPTFIQVCGMDPLRDDGLIFEEMLKEAGVRTMLDFYPGCPHAHFGFYPNIEPSVRALADTVVGVAWLLGKEVSPEQALGAYMKPS